MVIETFWKPVTLLKLTIMFAVVGRPAAVPRHPGHDAVVRQPRVRGGGARHRAPRRRASCCRELLPNVVPAAVSFALIGVAIAIVLEGSLAFLGLSIALPTSSLGNIINEGVQNNNLQHQPLHRPVAVALHLPAPHRPQPHGRPAALATSTSGR